MSNILDYILHIDTYLIAEIARFGLWSYLFLFIVIFAETGLIITPFLPGDSLLFALGSIAAQVDSSLRIEILFFLLVSASFIGNLCNYSVGRWLGPRVFKSNHWFLSKKHLEQAHEFYEKNGGKTIIIARFLPIIRTFAPFVAGVGYMGYSLFLLYNFASAILWVGLLLGFGYFFGSLPFIKDNFPLVIYGIILISVLPSLLTFLWKKNARNRSI